MRGVVEKMCGERPIDLASKKKSHTQSPQGKHPHRQYIYRKGRKIQSVGRSVSQEHFLQKKEHTPQEYAAEKNQSTRPGSNNQVRKMLDLYLRGDRKRGGFVRMENRRGNEEGKRRGREGVTGDGSARLRELFKG